MKKQDLIKRLMCFLLIIVVGCSRSLKINYVNGALPPDKAVETYHVAEGFQVQLFASEPQIQNPTDMTVDAYGRVYVTEMIGYPLEMNHTGKVKVLLDSDGDGVMDSSVTFADQLMFPNGVMPWKGGILVTDAPYVVYFKDMDGDNRADVRDTLLVGFDLSNPQINVNNPVYGLDNWIYLANFGPIAPRKYPKVFGDEGHKITFWDNPSGSFLPKEANRRSVRFKPEERKLQSLSSNSQFGQTFNEWGDYFLISNKEHIYEEILPSRYVDRNKNVSIPNAIESISDHGDQAVVYQVKKKPDGQIIWQPQITTSSSGMTYYSGGLFPPPYNEDVTFGAESAFNLVHADNLTPDKAAFRASRIQQKKEFFASTDEWARPVNAYIGPDGALYVLDFYQKIIEHPEWLSEEAIKAGGLYEGQKMGRIYRITPSGTPKASWTRGLSLGQASGEELVHHLSDNNSWWRMTAQQLLVTNNDLSVIDTLEEMVMHSDALGRLHALWTLDGLGALKIETIEKALRDPKAGIRRNAIRISEKYIDQSEDKDLVPALYSMADDTSAKVRFQLLNTLGYLTSEKAWQIEKKILLQDVADKWVRLSALTAKNVEPNRLLKVVIDTYRKDNKEEYLSLVQQLTALLSRSKDDQQTIANLIQSATENGGSMDDNLKSSILAGLTNGLKENEDHNSLLKPAESRLITTFLNHPSKPVRGQALQLLEIEKNVLNAKTIKKEVAKILQMVKNENLSAERRSQMLEFLVLTDPSPYVKELQELIVSTDAPAVQEIAIKILSRVSGTQVTQYLLENWKNIKKENKDVALNTFLKENDRMPLLLAALKTGNIPVQELDGSFRAQLLRTGDEKIKKEANSLLGSDDEGGIPKRYKKSLTLSGDVSKGSAIFMVNCSICHQMRGEMGAAYGPDLGMVRGWSKKDILANILDPNLSIATGFELQKVNLKNGEQVVGIIENQTSNAVTLKMNPQSKKTLNQENIKGMETLDISAMPVGFGNQLTPQKMADLIEFIKMGIN
jgi:putative membrane-bound dehydrogenase-like protein